MYFKGLPLYAFGHGLSYTSFSYSRLEVAQTSVGGAGKLTVSFDVRNTGTREGSEVAQLYTHQRASVVMQPIESLRAFTRVNLQPGESKRVILEVPRQQLAWYDVRVHDFRVEPGTYDLLVGSASDDIRLRASIEIPRTVSRTTTHGRSPGGQP